MKKRLLVITIMLLCSISGLYAFKTYTENVNPFNRFLNPVDGVDLYSGTVAFTKTLYTMKGRNGLDIGVNLKYSSNVYLQARTRNDKSPTSWLGLGWSLSYGSIKCNHKNTANPADDEFTWVSPEGYTRRLFVEFEIDLDNKPNGSVTCYMEEMPYLKVNCDYDFDNKVILGWVIKKTDGTVLRYGDELLDKRRYIYRNATRFTFHRNGYIEPFINPKSEETGKYQLYPYQWDLAYIRGNFDNQITFKYTQVCEKVRAKEWSNPSSSYYETDSLFTKASYVKEIVNPEGKKIVFEMVSKEDGEYYDPHLFESEPDGFIEMYETDRLANVKIYNSKSETIKVFLFDYSVLNQEMTDKYFRKSLLKRISEYNTQEDNYNIERFTYCDFFNKADDTHGDYDPNYNYGALKRHRDMKGFYVEYEYERKELELAKTDFIDITLDPIAIENNKFHLVNSAIGRKCDGNYPFAVVTTNDACFIYNWTGSKWLKGEIPIPEQLKINIIGDNPNCYCMNDIPNNCDTCITVTAGNDYFTLLGGQRYNRKLCVYNWNEDEEEWQIDTEVEGSDQYGIVDIVDPSYGAYTHNSHVVLYGSSEYFLVSKGNQPQSAETKITIWNKINKVNPRWKITLNDEVFHKFHGSGVSSQYSPVIQCAQNFIYISSYGHTYPDENKNTCVFSWDGYNWERTLNGNFNIVFPNYYYTVMSPNFGQNFISFFEEPSTNQRLLSFCWDGSQWIKTMDDQTVEDYYAKQTFNNSNFNLVTIKKTAAEEIRVRTWNGCEWKSQDWGYENDYGKYFITDDYAISITPGQTETNGHTKYMWDHSLNPPQWGVGKGYTSANHFLPHPLSWTAVDNNDPPICLMNKDFFISYVNNYSDFSDELCDINIWDGQKWKTPYGAHSGIFEWQNTVKVAATNDAIFLLKAIDSEWKQIAAYMQYKFQNSFEEKIYAYVIKKKTFKPGFGQVTEPITYLYENVCSECQKTGSCQSPSYDCDGSYDTKNGTAKFNKVSVKLANNARKEYYFFNDTESGGQSNENEEYRKLDGLRYKVINYDSEGNKIPSSEETKYEVYRESEWLEGIYSRRNVTDLTILDRVNTEIKTTYNSSYLYHIGFEPGDDNNFDPAIPLTEGGINNSGCNKIIHPSTFLDLPASTVSEIAGNYGKLTFFIKSSDGQSMNLEVRCFIGDEYVTLGSRNLVTSDEKYLQYDFYYNLKGKSPTDFSFHLFNTIGGYYFVDDVQVFTYAPDLNGLPRFRQVKNSDNNTVADFTVFAHEKYNDTYNPTDNMLQDNMLSQPCLKIVLENKDPLYEITNWSIPKEIIRSARAITWSNTHNTDNKWAPSSVYVWDVKKDNTGTPESDFTGFNFTPTASNPNWKLLSAITKYNEYGQVLETKRYGAGTDKLFSSRFYRNNIAQQLAEVVNAKYDECAFFTCDYDMNKQGEDAWNNSTYYFDLENGWEKPAGTVLANDNTMHFGQNTVKVTDAFGPSRNIKLENAQDYIVSAWVKVLQGTLEMWGDYRYFDNAADPNLPTNFKIPLNCTGADLQFLGNPEEKPIVVGPSDWQFIEFEIHAIEDIEDWEHYNWYARIYVGSPGNNLIAYIDDIRFYPTDALVTTTYYDQTWEKPIVSVDPNNNPGARMDYNRHKPITKNAMLEDDFGELNAEGSSLNYVGNLGFHPSDAMKINLYFDEIWQKPKIFMGDNSPAGKVIYDDFGREKEWYNMNHNGEDTLLIKKEYHFSGFVWIIDGVEGVGLDGVNPVAIFSKEEVGYEGGENVYFPGNEVTISCNPTIISGDTYTFNKWEIVKGTANMDNPNNNSVIVTMEDSDIEIQAVYTKN